MTGEAEERERANNGARVIYTETTFDDVDDDAQWKSFAPSTRRGRGARVGPGILASCGATTPPQMSFPWTASFARLQQPVDTPLWNPPPQLKFFLQILRSISWPISSWRHERMLELCGFINDLSSRRQILYNVIT